MSKFSLTKKTLIVTTGLIEEKGRQQKIYVQYYDSKTGMSYLAKGNGDYKKLVNYDNKQNVYLVLRKGRETLKNLCITITGEV